MRFHLLMQCTKDTLLGVHQIACIFVDQHQLLGWRQTVNARCSVAGTSQLAQASNPHGIEFIQIIGANRKEAQAFQQGNTRVFRFL